MDILALIPARYASTRFPGKPLALIAGKPMIRHVYEKVAGKFTDCWVATDDHRIRMAVEGFGGRVVMTSPDHTSGTDRCAEAYSTVSDLTGKDYRVVINIQGDEPFVSADHLEGIISAFESPGTEIATLVKEFSPGEDIFDPNVPKVVFTADGNAVYFSRSVIPYVRGAAPDTWSSVQRFYKHIGMYAFRPDVLLRVTRLPAGRLERAESLEQLRWLENGIKITVVRTDSESVSVDTPEDLDRVAGILASGSAKG